MVESFSRLMQQADESADAGAHVAMRFFVGDLLRAMDRQGMKKADLASAISVSPAYITRIMHADVNFTLETMAKLAMAVGGRLDVRILDKAQVGRAPRRASSRRKLASS